MSEMTKGILWTLLYLFGGSVVLTALWLTFMAGVIKIHENLGLKWVLAFMLALLVIIVCTYIFILRPELIRSIESK